MRRLVAAVLLLALAGCSSPAANDGGEVVSGIQYDDGGANKVDLPILDATPPAPGERTLAAAPQWRLGEWWEYKVTDHFAGKQITIKRVVAGTFGTQYLVGFPIDAFSNDALVMHVPGYGDIDQADLSFETHDVDFKMLDFPLTVGKKWDTAWEGLPGTATIVSATSEQATIRITDGQNFNWTATYDAVAGDIVRLSDPNYATIELTEHGYNHVGAVRVPHAHDLVFMNGRLGPWDIQAHITQNPEPAPATETVDVKAGYDRLAFTIIVGPVANLLVDGLPPVPGAGTYSEKVMSPNGTIYELASGPTDTGLKLEFYGTGDPTGTWTLEHAANGPGIVLTEGIGYHSIDIDLPSGCVLPGQNAGHHLNPCTGTVGAATP